MAYSDNVLFGMELPYSLEAEQSVLGAVLVEPSVLAGLMEKLKPEYFYRPQHRDIFEIMTSMFTAGEPVDTVTLLEQVKAENVFPSESDARVYFAHLMEIVPTVRNLDAYVDIILDKQLTRSLMQAAGSIIDEARGGSEEGRLLLDSAEQQIYDIRQGRDSKGLVPVSEVILETYDRLQKLAGEDREKYMGLKTDFSALDNLITGFNKTDLIILAARPGMGKTSFALNIAANVSEKHKKKVAVFSLEMSKEQIVSRMLSGDAQVESRLLRDGSLSAADWQRLAEAAQILSRSPVLVDDSAGVTVTEIKARLRRIRDLDLVVIDYLQLMSSGKRIDNRVQEVSEMTRSLKLMAKELNVPVLVLSQLSRAGESRPREQRRPMLSDLRESGSIEQDADIVLFLYRESYYDRDDPSAPIPEQDTAECIVAKNRHGETGTAKLRWDGQFTRFYTLDSYHEG